MIEWCFTLLSTLIQSYQSDISCILTVLGYGSEVSCPKVNPTKNRGSSPDSGHEPCTLPLSQAEATCTL